MKTALLSTGVRTVSVVHLAPRAVPSGKHRHRLIPLLSLRNQDVAMQHRSRLPGVSDDSLSILIINAFCCIGSLFPITMFHDGKQLGVLHLQGIASLRISSSRLSSLACAISRAAVAPHKRIYSFVIILQNMCAKIRRNLHFPFVFSNILCTFALKFN